MSETNEAIKAWQWAEDHWEKAPRPVDMIHAAVLASITSALDAFRVSIVAASGDEPEGALFIRTREHDRVLEQERQRRYSVEIELAKLKDSTSGGMFPPIEKEIRAVLDARQGETTLEAAKRLRSAHTILTETLTVANNTVARYQNGAAERECRAALGAYTEETSVAACRRVRHILDEQEASDRLTREQLGAKEGEATSVAAKRICERVSAIREEVIRYLEAEWRKDLEAAEGESAHQAGKRLLQSFKASLRHGTKTGRYARWATVASIRAGGKTLDVPVCVGDTATMIGENLLAALEAAK